MKLNTKLRVDAVSSRFVASQNIRATECLAWCSRNYVFSLRTASYPFQKHVAQALEGYRQVPKFPILELATHAWFAGRCNEAYSSNLLAIGFSDRQKCGRLGDVERKFAERFAVAIEEDLRPIISIVCTELRKAIPEEDRAYDAANFSTQWVNTFELAVERHLNFEDSPLIPKGMKSLGTAALVPFIDVIPHAEKQANSVVCVTSNECEESSVRNWAEDVGIADAEAYHRPVLLLATRNISEGRPVLRDCSSKLVGVTSGRLQAKLPPRRQVTLQHHRPFSTAHSRVLVNKLITPEDDILSALSSVDDHVPAITSPDQVVVEIRARAMNWVDLLMVFGQYQHAPRLPYTIGMEYSGTVVALGKGADGGLSSGDKVFVDAFSNVGPRSSSPEYQMYGGFARFALLPRSAVCVAPREASFSSLCAFAGPYETAFYALVTRGDIQEGESVWVLGATGSTGSAAAQLCLNCFKSKNIVLLGGSRQKLEHVRSWLGNDPRIVIAQYDDDFKALPRANVVFDTVGGVVSDKAIRACEFAARFLLVGWTSTPLAGGGRAAGADHQTANSIKTNLILMKGLSVIGCPAVISSSRSHTMRAERTRVLNEWLRNGAIRPLVQEYDANSSSLIEACVLAARDKWSRRVIGTAVVCD